MSHGFQPGTANVVREAALHEWVRLLRPFSKSIITKAFDEFGRGNPRAKPTPYDIETRCSVERTRRARMAEVSALPKPAFKSLAKPDEPRISPEKAQQISEEAGFDPERTRLVKKFPRARSVEEAARLDHKADRPKLSFDEYMTAEEQAEYFGRQNA